MKVVSVEQARRHRLRARCSIYAYGIEDAAELAGACGMQNTPPGAWGRPCPTARRPVAGRCRAPARRSGRDTRAGVESCAARPWFPRPKARRSCRRSFRRRGEPWAYTKGIGLCARCAGHEFDRLLELLVWRTPRLTTRRSRARWRSIKRWRIGSSRCFLRTSARRRQPSMYGSPDKQTVEEPRCRSCCARARSWYSSCTASAGNAHVHLVPKVDGRAAAGRRRRRAPGAEVRPLLRADDTDALCGWTGCSGAQARRMEGHCGRAGAGGVRRRRHGRWRPTSMRSHR